MSHGATDSLPTRSYTATLASCSQKFSGTLIAVPTTLNEQVGEAFRSNNIATFKKKKKEEKSERNPETSTRQSTGWQYFTQPQTLMHEYLCAFPTHRSPIIFSPNIFLFLCFFIVNVCAFYLPFSLFFFGSLGLSAFLCWLGDVLKSGRKRCHVSEVFLNEVLRSLHEHRLGLSQHAKGSVIPV